MWLNWSFWAEFGGYFTGIKFHFKRPIKLLVISHTSLYIHTQGTYINLSSIANLSEIRHCLIIFKFLALIFCK